MPQGIHWAWGLLGGGSVARAAHAWGITNDVYRHQSPRGTVLLVQLGAAPKDPLAGGGRGLRGAQDIQLAFGLTCPEQDMACQA